MMHKAVLWTVVALCAAATHFRQDNLAELDRRIESIASETLEFDGVEGFSTLIAFGDELYLHELWGFVDADEPLELDRVYRAGTLTDVFVTVAALQLAQQERLDLDDPLQRHFEALVFEDEEITLQNLLSHSSGLPSYFDLPGYGMQVGPEKEEVLAWLAQMSLDSASGECSAYSATNVLLLGWIVESVTGMEVPDYLTKHVFEPAGMTDTIYCSDGVPLHENANIVREFAGIVEGQPKVGQPFQAEGLCTTAGDLFGFWRGLVERELIDDASWQLMSSSRVLRDGVESSHGMGLDLTSLEDRARLSFGGGIGGSRVHLGFYPELDATIIVLAHGDDAPVHVIERRLARAIFDLPDPDVRDLELDEDDCARYVGSYFVVCNEYKVKKEDDGLFLYTAIGERYELQYQGNHRFVAADNEVMVTFELDGDYAQSFVLLEYGAESIAHRRG